MAKYKLSFFMLFAVFGLSACNPIGGTSSESTSDTSSSSEEVTYSHHPRGGDSSSQAEPVYLHYPATGPTCTTFGNKECWIKESNGAVYLARPSGSQIVEGTTPLQDNPTKEYHIGALGHDLELDYYVWSTDYSSARAHIHCKRNDCNYEAEPKATVTESIIANPTCQTQGVKTCTASYLDLPTDTTDNLPIDQLDHDYEFSAFAWDISDLNNITASANYVCQNGCEHVEPHAAAVTNQGVEQEKSCTEDEITRFRATYENHQEDNLVKTADKLGHNWGDPVPSVGLYCASVTMTRTCQRDSAHVETETAIGQIEEETDEHIIYSYSFENPAFSHPNETYNKPAPAHVHSPDGHGEYEEEASTCIKQGHIAYYKCSGCELKFKDAALTQPIASDAEYLLPLGGHTPGTPVNENIINPTCTEKGSHDSVIYCSVCDEELSRTPVEDPANGHHDPLTHQAETNSSCTEHGYKEYWYCEDCNTYFKDVECTEPTTLEERTKPLTAHSYEYHHDADQDWQECSVCHDETAHTDHTGASPVEENLVAPTCTTDGSHDLVIYCEKCGYELSRNHEDLPRLGHDYVINYVWSNDHSTVTATAICKNNSSHVVEETVNLASTVVEGVTCSSGGTTTYTSEPFTNSDVFTAPAVDIVETPLDPNAHSYDEPYYKWTKGSKDITAGTVCFYNETHNKDWTDSGVDNSTEMKPAGTWEDRLSYTLTGDSMSPLYDTDTRFTTQTLGDVNMYFSNIIKDSSGTELGGKGMKYDAIVDFTLTRSDETSSINTFFVKLDNSYYYDDNALYGSYDGKSYIVFYNDLSYVHDSQDDGFNQYANTIEAYDNLGHLSHGSLMSDTEFVSDFLKFSQDCRIEVRTYMDVTTHVATVQYKYYSNVAGTDAKYNGYTQTFKAKYSDKDFNCTDAMTKRYINSVRIARAVNGSTMDINSITYYYSIDKNIVSYKTIEAYWRTFPWAQYHQFQDPIVNISGDETHHVWPKP